MPLGTEVGLGPGHIVLHGDLTPPPKKKAGTAPNFRPIPIVTYLVRPRYSRDSTRRPIGLGGLVHEKALPSITKFV